MRNSQLSNIHDLYLFSQVVDHKGFSPAAQALGIPKSRVSRHVARLEEFLGVRLLQRTSRRFGLTEAGRLLYPHCEAMLAQAKAGEDAVRSLGSVPSGLVRMSVPLELSDNYLSQLMARFMAQYPLVRLDVQVTNRQVDLLAEGVDIAVRGGEPILENSSLVLIPLGHVNWRLVASPTLLQRYPLVSQPAALIEIPLLAQTCGEAVFGLQSLWSVTGDSVRVPVNVRMQSDNIHLLLQAALAGHGVCGLPDYCCASALADGRLVTVLPDWRPRAGRVFALLPSRPGMTVAVRSMLDFLKAELPPMLLNTDLSS
jgi:DNA-binding transcriptional LysR family regulator